MQEENKTFKYGTDDVRLLAAYLELLGHPLPYRELIKNLNETSKEFREGLWQIPR